MTVIWRCCAPAGVGTATTVGITLSVAVCAGVYRRYSPPRWRSWPPSTLSLARRYHPELRRLQRSSFWLHRRVRHVRQLAHGLNVLGRGFNRSGGGTQLLRDAFRALAGSVTFVQFDGNRFEAFTRVPVGNRNSRNAGADVHNVFDARHRLGIGAVEALELAAEHQTLRHRCNHYAGCLYVDTKFGSTVDFQRRVKSFDRFTHVLEVAGTLERVSAASSP